MHQKVVALMLAFLMASLPAVMAQTVSFQSGSAPIAAILSPSSGDQITGSMITLEFSALDLDGDLASCLYQVESPVGTIRKSEDVPCSGTEVTKTVTVPVGNDGCRSGQQCKLRVSAHDSANHVGGADVTVAVGTPDNTGNENSDISVGIESLGSEWTGRLTLKAAAEAPSGVQTIEIYVGYQLPNQNVQQPRRAFQCSNEVKCEFNDQNTYPTDTTITYYATARARNGATAESEHKTLVIENSVTGDAANNFQCTQSCSSTAGTSEIGLGYCSDDGEIPADVRTQINNLGAARGPIRNTKVTCQLGQSCWCVYINYENGFSQIGQQCDRYVQARPPLSWDDPARMEDAPTNPASPPTYACAEGTKATVIANLSQSPVEAGTNVVVSGAVGRITEKCAGYEYQCRTQRVLGCNVDDKLFTTNFEYQQCPSQYTQIHAEGAGKKFKWGLMLRILGAACSIAFGAIGAPGGDTASLPPGEPVPEGPNYAKGLGQKQAVVYNQAGKNDNSITGHIAWLVILYWVGRGLCTAVNTASPIICSQTRQLPACYNVCGKDTTTDAVPNYQRVCGTTGASYVTSATPATYACAASPKSACGGFPGKEVSLKIRNAAGALVRETTLYTDANGWFDYTFQAPFTEGRYNAIVTVPGGI